jgi:SAM-dependent methyltransferase
MPYDPAIYSGCAEHYLRGRPPYSHDLAPALAARLGTLVGGQLLDVGAGTGAVAHALRTLFSRIVAVEPDHGMVSAGMAWARSEGLTQLSYLHARAEMLGELELGHFELVTFGQSFHWTSRDAVAALAFARVLPGGGIALITHQHAGRPQPAGPGAPLIPHEAVHALIRRYLGPARRAGNGLAPVLPGFDEEAVLAGAGFIDIKRLYCPGRTDLVRDVDAVVSNFLSMSFAAPPLFGDRLDDFCTELRALLLDASPGGEFWDWPGDTEVVFARKPSAQSLRAH